MKNSLKSLSRIQKFNIDEQRKILNAHLEEEEKLVAKLDKLNDEFIMEKAFAKLHEEFDFGTYLERYLKERAALEQAIVAVREKIEEVKDVIRELYKEQKTYDIVDENRQKRHQKEQDDKEQKMLDEIGTNAYIKKRTKKQ